MTQLLRPSFMDSQYYYTDDECQSQLTADAPADIRKEFDEYIEAMNNTGNMPVLSELK